MPSIKTITPILPERYYHIFNRGANKKRIFYTSENYNYFLFLLKKFLLTHIEVLAYSLLPNHFHIIDYTKSTTLNDNQYKIDITKAFKQLFISYAMAINNQENFTGNLFDPKFKRLEIDKEDYLKYLVFYTHYNPEKHRIINDFRQYHFSSYNAYVSISRSEIARKKILDLFGGQDEFMNYHQFIHSERQNLILE